MSIFSKEVTREGKIKFRLFGRKVFTFKHKKEFFNCKDYAEWIDNLHVNGSCFVPFTKKPYKRKVDDIKIFAYYLSQFHSIEENDKAHGKGFTEWTNVASATPQFVGHYQPKIPYDMGFYNLLQPGVMERQVEIAKAYGIYGFCFYYYWFSGKKVLEKPLEYFLNSDIDFHFHFCWANENWSKLWDGGDKEVILEQKLQDGDAEKFFADILPFIKDKRYEKVKNKPLLMIYKPQIFDRDKLKSFLSTLNEKAIKTGFDGFHFMASNASNFNTPKEYGFEGIIEFPPHGMFEKCRLVNIKGLSRKQTLNIVDPHAYIEQKKYLNDVDYRLYKACFPNWDNAPRKAYSGGYCCMLSEDDYASWLKGIVQWTKDNNPADEQYIYVNAWNEWAEGAILEPTTRWGYRYLQIINDCCFSKKTTFVKNSASERA